LSTLIIAFILAVVAAMQPGLMVKSIDLLDSPHLPRQRTWRFVGGVASTLVVVGLIVAIVARLIVRSDQVPVSSIDTTDVTFGVLTIIAVGIGAVAGHQYSPARRRPKPLPPTDRACFVDGVRTVATNPAGLVLYIASLNEVVAFGATWSTTNVLVLAVSLIVMLPALAPPLVEAAMPNGSQRVLQSLHRWGTGDGPVIAGLIITATGMALAVRGLWV
jgi:threonine/homoserine/homoserine lactone efflux protein